MMDLAFQLPDHLPRSKSQQPQTSTVVLTSLAEASPVTLADTTKWVNELDNAVLETKKDIHDRIHRDFNAFQRQLHASQSIQRRLAILAVNVNALGAELDDEEIGVVPVMLNALRHHSDLAQRSYEAELTSTSVQYLGKCRDKYKVLLGQIEGRSLPQAVTTGAELQQLLESCPFPLNKSKVISDLQYRSRQSRDNVQEQLLQALMECLSLTETRFSIHPRYQSLELREIFTSVPNDVLSTTLSSIRKEIFARYVDRALGEHVYLALTSDTTLDVQSSHFRDCIPALLNIFTFIHDRLLPSLSDTHRTSFAASFYIGLSEAVQTQLLVKAIPDNVDGLAEYLGIIRAAIDFELKVTSMGFFSGGERRIQGWGDGAQAHYEKKRRAALVDHARVIILTDNQPATRITGEPIAVPVAEEIEEAATPEEEVNWDFEDDEGTKVQQNGTPPKHDAMLKGTDEAEPEAEADGWGFDDEDEPLGEANAGKDAEETNDPWGVEWDDTPAPEPKNTRPTVTESKPSFSSQSTTGQSFQTAASSTHNRSPMQASLETYLVSHAATAVADLAGHILDEAFALLNSTVFTEFHFLFTSSALLLSTVPSVFDLFRAMYPVSHATELQHERSRRLQYSNDAKYLAEVTRKLRTRYDSAQFAKVETVGMRFDETADRLGVVSASWLDDTVYEEVQKLLKLMSDAGSFMDLAYEAQFAEEEAAIKRVKNEIMHISRDFLGPLTPSACYTSLGIIVNQVIDQMLKDVFAIRDISEIVSERLATLCRTLHPLDTLFPELENGVSTVASYVPLWLKFTYLSDILEGSIAEISSWSDAGHLVDYEPAELSRLIEALFADTPLRATTIAKILRS